MNIWHIEGGHPLKGTAKVQGAKNAVLPIMAASVLCGYLLKSMGQGKWKKILFAPTGALLSPTSSFQGESIPGICHAVVIAAEGGT